MTPICLNSSGGAHTSGINHSLESKRQSVTEMISQIRYLFITVEITIFLYLKSAEMIIENDLILIINYIKEPTHYRYDDYLQH